jgi:drug/metabolite transporter (DMT)-like permease
MYMKKLVLLSNSSANFTFKPAICWLFFCLLIPSINLKNNAYQWFCALAYRQAQASQIVVAEYTGLLFCVFFGWLFFDEWLDGLSWVGAGFIVLPSLIIPWIQAKRGQKKFIEQNAG